MSFLSTALNTSNSCGSFQPVGFIAGAGPVVEMRRVMVERMLAHDGLRACSDGDCDSEPSADPSSADDVLPLRPESDREGLDLI